VARGEAAFDADWLGITNLWVSPEHRRTGLARRVLAELLEWGAEQGALTVWLHVETDNAEALALYEGIGLRTHHTMRYLTPTP
jgi:ribosomal protein S18 acetylase RimI-like enzyme